MTVRWVTRNQCGLVLPNFSHLSTRNDKPWGITKHHTGSARPVVPLDSLRLWRELQAEAMSGNNVNHTVYGDIEYNVGFDDFGQILIGRDTRYVGAHAASKDNVANRFTFGIAYLGGLVTNTDDGQPRGQAMDALKAYAYVASFVFGHAALTLGHLDWAKWGGIATSCPGPKLEHSYP